MAAAVISRYARAFAEVILDHKLDAQAILGELQTMLDLFHASPELLKVMENPAVPAPEKLSLLDALARRIGLSRWVRNFVAVLMDQHRIAALPKIVEQLRAELNRRLGIAEAEVASARELEGEEKAGLESRLAAVTGQVVHARYRTDPQLLGGATVRIGSTIYDGSIRGQLRRLKEALAGA